jgi:predicted phosphodiesterase
MVTTPQNVNAGSKDYVLKSMSATVQALQSHNPKAMQALDEVQGVNGLPAGVEDRRNLVIKELQGSIESSKKEPESECQAFHSREPLTGIIQSNLESSILPELQAYAEGNPIVWIPAGIKGVLEHCLAKYPFKTATAQSMVTIPDKCKIALLADWGADNDHAKNVAQQAMARNPDYMIHLGDIYYSGSESECQTFLRNWPLRGVTGAPLKGKSFALNGNHEMYSLGVPYFQTVLPALGQEASYFTLANERWQLHGLDTAYLPFSINGRNEDSRLLAQWEWLRNSMRVSPQKRNIFLSHNQPVSAHLPEFEAAQPLMDEARTLMQEFGLGSIFGWFFGHEHRCAIYDDKDISAMFRARLIGNGSIGHHPQEETAPAVDETRAHTNPFMWVNKRSLEDKGVVAISSFALLSLDGDTIEVEYIDEDGFVGYKETWKA